MQDRSSKAGKTPAALRGDGNRSGNRGKGRQDTNQIAFNVVQQAIGDAPKVDPFEGKNPAAVTLGRLGGLKGGRARAAAMTPAQRSEIAAKAAMARWASRNKK